MESLFQHLKVSSEGIVERVIERLFANGNFLPWKDKLFKKNITKETVVGKWHHCLQNLVSCVGKSDFGSEALVFS